MASSQTFSSNVDRFFESSSATPAKQRTGSRRSAFSRQPSARLLTADG